MKDHAVDYHNGMNKRWQKKVQRLWSEWRWLDILSHWPGLLQKKNERSSCNTITGGDSLGTAGTFRQLAAELQQQKLPPMFLLWELRPGYEAAKCSQNQPFFNALAAYMYVKPTQNYNILYIMF